MGLAGFESILPRPALDPRRSFVHGNYAIAEQRLLGATRMGPGVLVLTGAAGTGKTTLIAELAARLGQEGHCVEWVASPRMDTENLLRLVGFALGLQTQRSSRTGLAWEPEHRDSAQWLRSGRFDRSLFLDNLPDTGRLDPGPAQGIRATRKDCRWSLVAVYAEISNGARPRPGGCSRSSRYRHRMIPAFGDR
jgi:hypothetical protein